MTCFKVGDRVEFVSSTWVAGLRNNTGTITHNDGSFYWVVFDSPTYPPHSSTMGWPCSSSSLRSWAPLTPFQELVKEYIDAELKVLHG